MNQSSEADAESREEKEINRYFALSTVSLAMTTAGGLFYPPLMALSIPVILVANKPFWQHAYKSLFKDKQIDVALIDIISVGGSILTGHLFAAALALANWFSNFSRKLLLKTEDHSRQSLINVFGEQPNLVWIQKADGVEVQIPFEALEIGDTIVVDAGQTMPIDGTITSGVGTIDQRDGITEDELLTYTAGINDSIALKTAHVGISMRGASTIATDTAGIILMDGRFA